MATVMPMAEQALVISQIRAIATAARSLDAAQLRDFCAAREHAMAIGPLLQPTSWLQNGFDDERNWIRIAEKLAEFRELIAEVTGQ